MSDVPDCTECGACCDLSRAPKHLDLSIYIQVREDEAAFGKVAARQTPNSEGRFVLPMKNRKCPHFVGEAGSSCSCNVYDDRPIVCRELVPGSYECLKDRHWAKLGPDPRGRQVEGCNEVVC